MEVNLQQILDAREARVSRQRELSREYGLPILSFSMNIPGPVKDSPLIRRGFLAGCSALAHRLPKNAIRFHRQIQADTGWEALYVLDLPPLEAKRIAVRIEDTHGLGRLFDMDVLDRDCVKLEREAVGGNSRNCIVCGAPGRGCASRRTHTVPQLQEATRDILCRYFRRTDRERIGSLAVKGLLYEVCTTPKPGLVDRRNSGSHRDMDLSTFLSSAAALGPYFVRCAQIGQDTAALPPEQTFAALRIAGLEAEETMLAVTGGVNTHKGAIFTMGILCGAAGRLWQPQGGWEENALFREIAAMTAEVLEMELRQSGNVTAGQRLYAENGIRGIRGEVARGLPTVREVGLPVFRRCLSQGMAENDAGAVTLLHLITRAEDTNLLTRGGSVDAQEAVNRVSTLLGQSPYPAMAEIEALDDWFISRNLSPGGSADLLAAVYFLHALNR